MKQYLDLLQHVLDNGKQKSDRTGTGTRSVFGAQMRFDLNEGFPLVTTKKAHFKSVVAELLWFLSGSTNVKDLQAMGCKIWDEWANKDGDLGPIYGQQWRSWTGTKTPMDGMLRQEAKPIDQITQVIHAIKTNPDSRRHIVSAWSVADIPNMALAPCHALFQFDVTDGKLSCQLYQRSADLFLGVPFNIASYALLTHMVALECGLQVGDFIWTGGDCHIYNNHVEQINLQLTRTPLPLPKLGIRSAYIQIFDYKPGDIELVDYSPHPAIKGSVAV